MMPTTTLNAILVLSLLLFFDLSSTLPLSTNQRWIVDSSSGERVKLRCVNWASHLEPMLAEGLDKQPLKNIAARVMALRFNCVRLTWPTFMFTRPDYGNTTVENTFDSLNLDAAKEGIRKNNPWVLNMTHIEAFTKVVDELGAHGVMVVLDNHVSKPKWCCPYADGNGFIGDYYFDPSEWLLGLATVAKHFNGKKQVVAMSLRNELRGPLQNVDDWYEYITRAAEGVHMANPDVLVIVSGLTWASDLSFLKTRPLDLNFHNKLVYEAHWYSFSGDSRVWVNQPLNHICANASKGMDDRVGFVMDGRGSVPLFLGEFGFDQRGVSQADNRFLCCFMGYMMERDLDWGLWALQGSYYFREGIIGPEETFGVLDVNWLRPRNQMFSTRFQLVQSMIQDPNSNFLTFKTIYHPQSGQCVSAIARNKIYLSNCKKSSKWSYAGDGSPIKLIGTNLCLRIIAEGLPLQLSSDCYSKQSAWTEISESKLHLAAMDGEGNYLCFEKKSPTSSVILSKSCMCVGDDSGCMLNPDMQWFKLVSANVEL